MADPRHLIGLAAEEAVAAWLSRRGWRVVARRYRSSGGGEVDLIALDPAAVLVGIEVRARRTARTGIGAETVDHRRVARIGRSLVHFAASSGAPHRGLRVDLVIVSADASGRWTARRIPEVGG